jgi:hypothetical protein
MRGKVMQVTPGPNGNILESCLSLGSQILYRYLSGNNMEGYHSKFGHTIPAFAWQG